MSDPYRTVGLVGHKSKIAERFADLVVGQCREMYLEDDPGDVDTFLVCAGLLHGFHIADIDDEQADDTTRINFVHVAQFCDRVLTKHSGARIVVIGSESAYRGSFDEVYAGAKAALHAFVENRPLLPEQQLVAISPGIVGDAGMTTRRTDLDRLQRRRDAHPKRRFVTSIEVARLARFLLFDDEGFLTGTVIRMHGGGG